MDSRILFIIFLCTFIIVISLIKVENFVTTRSIIAEDELSNEDYHKCINENDILYYKTKGTYNSCNKILNNLTNWGLKTNTNLGFGKFDDMCSFSAMKKLPSNCLEKHIDRQNQTIKDINNLFTDSGNNESFFRNNFEKNINIHKQYVDKLYKKPEINEVVDYLYLYSYPVSDNIYNSILNEKKSSQIGGGSENNNGLNPPSTSSSTSSSTPSSTVISPTRFQKAFGDKTQTSGTEVSLTPPAIIFNTSNMNLERKNTNTTAVLGYQV